MKTGVWTRAEDELLREMARTAVKSVIAAKLDRSVNAVTCRMWLKGLRGPKTWSAEEDAVLLNARPGTKVKELAAQLGRSWQAVWQRRAMIGASFTSKNHWTAVEDARLRELAWKVEVAQIAAELGRTEWAVKGRIQRLGIKQGRAWTAEEDAILLNAGPNAKIRDLVEKTGRSRNAVCYHRIKLNISAGTKPHWTPAELEKLRAEAPGQTLEWIAGRMGRSVRSIEHKARELELPIAGAKTSRSSRPRVKRERRQPHARQVRTEVSRIAYCQVCHAPVVNTADGWTKHNQRMGCNRKIARAA